MVMVMVMVNGMYLRLRGPGRPVGLWLKKSQDGNKKLLVDEGIGATGRRVQ